MSGTTGQSTRTSASGLPGSGTLLDVRDIRTHFRTPRGLLRAVDGVSLKLERGKTLGVVGESGSGKSVLSRSIMRLLPRSNVISSGQVLFEGKDITALPENDLRKLWGNDISMIFQDPMTALNPVLPIGRQITETLRLHLGMNKRDARDTAIALLSAVRIPEPEKRFNGYPHELSGGMRQRIVIAVALACGPKLLFADEPTTALDVTVQAQILDLLAEQQRDRYMAMIMVTHDLGVVAGRADEIMVMYAGRVVERAPTRALFADLRMPYTEALLAAIPRLDQPSHSRLSAISGRPPDLVSPPKGCAFSPRCPYARQRCFEETPELTPTAENPEHEFACFYPIGSPETEERRVEISARENSDSPQAATAGTAGALGAPPVGRTGAMGGH